MAVQKSKKTPSKRGMRRAHSRLKGATLSTDATTGLSHRRHHIAEDGYYRGREVIHIGPKDNEDQEDQ